VRQIKKLSLPNSKINTIYFAQFFRKPGRIIARRTAHITDPINVGTDSKSPTFNFDKTFVWIAISEHENYLLFVCVYLCACVLPKIAILNIDQKDGSTINCSLIKRPCMKHMCLQ
jgi:hypothetical protein